MAAIGSSGGGRRSLIPGGKDHQRGFQRHRQNVVLRSLFRFLGMLLNFLAVKIAIFSPDRLPIDNVVDPNGVTERQLATERAQVYDRERDAILVRYLRLFHLGEPFGAHSGPRGERVGSLHPHQPDQGRSLLIRGAFLAHLVQIRQPGGK